MDVYIVGAGSIGNHMARASRELGWHVTVFDISEIALVRMRQEIYPSRYGAWDPEIELSARDLIGVRAFDLVIIGTPPDHHLRLAMKALAHSPRGILIEKPLCAPSLEDAQAVFAASQKARTHVFVGYDHVVGEAAGAVAHHVRSRVIGDVLTIDVEFREHWAGIFKAHPWLQGPEDSYLGFSARGGGASGEHSHALNLWQHLAHVAGAGRVTEVSAMLTFAAADAARYDELCFMLLRTEQGLMGRVAQDVVTLPPSKRARIQGTNGSVEWINGYDAQGDAVVVRPHGQEEQLLRFPKRRVDDFIRELRHVADRLASGAEPSEIRLERGLDTALVLAAAHRSDRERKSVRIDYSSGYSLDALM